MINIRRLFSFVFFNFLLWCLLSLSYFKTNGFFTDNLGIVFTSLFIPGHLFLFAVGLFLLALPWMFIGPKTFKTASILLALLVTLFFAVDTLVFSQYRFHISLAMLQLFFGPAGKEIFVFPASTWFIVAGAVLVLIVAEWGLFNLTRKICFSGKAITVLSVLLFFLCAGYNCMYAWGKFMMVPSVMAQRTVLPFANPLSANSRLRKWGFEPKRGAYTMPSKGNLNYPIKSLSCSASNPKKNVLIILVDSWRKDSFNQEVMPHLFAWAQKPAMTLFQKHLSGGNATEAGVFSLFYSMPYSYWNDFTSRQLSPLLVSQALKQGYTPAIYSSAKLNSPTFHQNVFADIPNLRVESQGKSKWERDIDAVNGLTDFLDKKPADKPFFGFLFLDAPHGSDYPAEDTVFTPAGEQMNYLLLSKNTDPTPYLNRYKNSVYFVDRQLARVFDSLKKNNLLDNTFIILTGDHGQEVNDTHNNFWGHNSNFAKYQTEVPLLVWDPSRKGSVKEYTTNHYDFAPTVLTHVFGCTNPPQDYSIGMDLFDDTPRPFSIISSYTKKAVRTGDKITVIDAYGNLEHYDDEFNPIPDGAAPAAMAEAFKTFSKFYK